jgi:SAM-dependent methyltransferase
VPVEDLIGRLACPVDRSPLVADEGGARCSGGHRYEVGEAGYLEVAPEGSPVLSIDSTFDEAAHGQEAGGERVYEAYLRPWLDQGQAGPVLDAGCGLGITVDALRQEGIEAVGVDTRQVARRWRQAGRDPAGFVVGDGVALPFPDASFAAVLCLGVLEHVGTVTGHVTLAPGWRATRQAFARELRRVTRPGGRILLACPNKWFPVDVQHGPSDQASSAPLRDRIFARWKVNVHRTWGDHHLVSYRDLDRWYGADTVRALPLTGYFGFSALERPGMPAAVASAARRWVDDLPATLRKTPLNPYLLAEVRA